MSNHMEYNQVLFGLDVVNIIEKQVQDLAKAHWERAKLKSPVLI